MDNDAILKVPDGIPERMREDFRNARDRLLGAYGMTPAALLEAIDDVLAVHAEDMADPAYAEYERHLGRADRHIALLTRLIHVAGLEPEAGLALLTDPAHAAVTTHGKKMRNGRKVGTIGAVRKWIRHKLSKAPTIKNAELWDAIKAKPPKGWKPMESPRLGCYIEGPSATDNVSYKTLCTYAALERKYLKIHD